MNKIYFVLLLLCFVPISSAQQAEIQIECGQEDFLTDQSQCEIGQSFTEEQGGFPESPVIACPRPSKTYSELIDALEGIKTKIKSESCNDQEAAEITDDLSNLVGNGRTRFVSLINKGVFGKGQLSEEEVQDVTQYVEKVVAKAGNFIDVIDTNANCFPDNNPEARASVLSYISAAISEVSGSVGALAGPLGAKINLAGKLGATLLGSVGKIVDAQKDKGYRFEKSQVGYQNIKNYFNTLCTYYDFKEDIDALTGVFVDPEINLHVALKRVEKYIENVTEHCPNGRCEELIAKYEKAYPNSFASLVYGQWSRRTAEEDEPEEEDSEDEAKKVPTPESEEAQAKEFRSLFENTNTSIALEQLSPGITDELENAIDLESAPVVVAEPAVEEPVADEAPQMLSPNPGSGRTLSPSPMPQAPGGDFRSGHSGGGLGAGDDDQDDPVFSAPLVSDESLTASDDDGDEALALPIQAMDEDSGNESGEEGGQYVEETSGYDEMVFDFDDIELEETELLSPAEATFRALRLHQWIKKEQVARDKRLDELGDDGYDPLKDLQAQIEDVLIKKEAKRYMVFINDHLDERIDTFLTYITDELFDLLRLQNQMDLNDYDFMMEDMDYLYSEQGAVETFFEVLYEEGVDFASVLRMARMSQEQRDESERKIRKWQRESRSHLADMINAHALVFKRCQFFRKSLFKDSELVAGKGHYGAKVWNFFKDDPRSIDAACNKAAKSLTRSQKIMETVIYTNFAVYNFEPLERQFEPQKNYQSNWIASIIYAINRDLKAIGIGKDD